MKYLVIGTGGVGGNIAGFLSLAGKDVTCIARGQHLETIRKEGLLLKSDLKGEHSLKIDVCTAEEFRGKADVIFVCVKGYSLTSVTDLLDRASAPDTLIIPILNVYGTGRKLAGQVPDKTLLDGCIYIVGYISGPGEVTQQGSIFRMVFGARREQPVSASRLDNLAEDLRTTGMKVELSEDIQRDTFIKWAFISAMACTGAYYDVTMGALQQEGEIRDTFIDLSRESGEIGIRLGLQLPEDTVSYNLKVIDKIDPKTTASMQKDLQRGNRSEITELLFDMIRLGEDSGLKMPAYRRIAEKFS